VRVYGLYSLSGTTLATTLGWVITPTIALVQRDPMVGVHREDGCVIRKDYVVCAEALMFVVRTDEDSIGGTELILSDAQRGAELLARLEQQIEFMCEHCEGLGRNIEMKQPCTHCGGTGINPLADPRTCFCAPEQVIDPDDPEGLGVGFVADDCRVVTGREKPQELKPQQD
jgi:hypothetical protein